MAAIATTPVVRAVTVAVVSVVAAVTVVAILLAPGIATLTQASVVEPPLVTDEATVVVAATVATKATRTGRNQESAATVAHLHRALSAQWTDAPGDAGNGETEGSLRPVSTIRRTA